MDVTDWLVQPSPERMADPEGVDLGVDLAEHWFAANDLADLGDDDLVGSLAEFTGREFFNESPPPFGFTSDGKYPQPPQSSEATSSGDGPTGSGAVCGGLGACGTGLLSRGAAFRSFSTNDLQALQSLDAPLGLFSPAIGLSAPHVYGSHMGAPTDGRPGSQAWSRPALESVPEGAPSQGGTLPAPAPLPVPSGPVAGCGADSGSGSPAHAASTGFHPRLEQGATGGPHSTAPGLEAAARAAASSAAAPTPWVSCSWVSGATPAVAPPAQPLAPLVGGGLRSVPSTGALSSLMSNTLQLQGEGSGESQSEPDPGSAAPGPILSPLYQHAPTAQPAVLGDYRSAASAAAAVAAAAAAGLYSAAVQPGALAGLPQPFGLRPPAAYYGIPSAFAPPAVLPTGAYPLGLPLPMPTHMLPRPMQPAGLGEGTGGSGTGAAAAAGAATAAGGGSCSGQLRKSQSALELGAWRTASLSPEADVLEVPGAAAAGSKMIGRLTAEERVQRILRYRNKRNMRNFGREIKYQCRKTLADSRPRVGGRFARNDDPKSVMPNQTKKAQRLKTSPSSQQLQTLLQQQQQQAASGAHAAATASGGQQQQDHKAALQAQQQSRQQQLLLLHACAAAAAAQQQAGGARRTASSATTNTSTSASSDHPTTASTAGTAAAASSAATAAAAPGFASYCSTQAPLPPRVTAGSAGAAGATLPQPHPFMPAGGPPYPGVLHGVPYPSVGMRPGLPPPGALSYRPPGTLPAGMGLSQLQHYVAVNAAAQAAVQAVYAHLGVPHQPHAAGLAAAPSQLVPAHPISGCAYSVPMAAPLPTPPTSAPAGVAAGSAATRDSGDASCSGASSDVPPSAFIDALLSHMDTEPVAGLPHHTNMSGSHGAAVGGATSMTIDG